MLNDAPACRDALQGLGNILAHLPQRGAAAAGTDLGPGMHDPVTRQMVRQRAPGRLLPGGACNRDRFLALRRGLAGGFLEVLEPKLKLLDAGAALRGWSEPLPPEPSNLQLQPFDLDAESQLGCRPRGLSRMPRLALRQDHRVSGGEVRGQRLRRVWHQPRESYSQAAVTAYPQPTAVGRQLSLGMRQSIPDSR
jgi:hypothetical protein